MAADMQKLIEQLGALTAAVSSTGSSSSYSLGAAAAGTVAASGHPSPAQQPDPFSQMAQQMLAQNPNASFSELLEQMQAGTSSVAPASPTTECSGAGCAALGEVQALREEVARLTTVIDGMMALITAPTSEGGQ